MPGENEHPPIDDFARPGGERRGFSAEEMVACEECRRTNPPTRMNCLYCGASLPATGASAALRRPALRPLEEWEQGFNVVLLAGGAMTPARESQTPTRQSIDAAADLLRVDATRFDEVVRARESLPVARAATAEEARLIEERLGALGFDVLTVSDAELAIDSQPPRRVSRLALDGDSLEARTSGGERASAPWGDVVLLAVGLIRTKRVEVEERRGRVKPGGEVADAREIFSDEAALEIHAGGDESGWRVMSGSFDYSCLGARKALLARENFQTLVERLRERAAGAAFDDGYERVRHLLNVAWPPSERAESGGLRRERPGKFNAEAVTVVSNEAQFTRYARLRRLLELRRRSELKA